MNEQVTYQIAVRQDDDGWFYAEVLDLPGCFASGETMEELEEALHEALEMYLSSANVNAKVTGFSLTHGRLVEDDHVPGRVELQLA